MGGFMLSWLCPDKPIQPANLHPLAPECAEIPPNCRLPATRREAISSENMTFRRR